MFSGYFGSPFLLLNPPFVTGHTSPEGAVSYTYDANSNVLTVNDSHGTITRTYDALNRVLSYTDTYGKVIRYEYDAVGNLSKIIYPDNTAVTYAYDANHNLVRVTDWANRVTTYTYDVNNRVVGVAKPDGSVTTTVYDNKQRVTSTVERTATSAVITGFEYTYDDLSRIIEEKVLANSTKMCYTYDNLNRVTKRTIKNLSNVVLSEEAFTYDAAGNITDAPDSCFMYDTNNRLVVFNGNTVSYDLDGNMLSNGSLSCTYDSANRLVSAGGHTYTYNAEDVRIRNLCAEEDTTYTYNTNAKLSMLLMKTTNGVVTKYVYGKGLIGEEVSGAFKTYHFDCRGSTIAITDASGNITDTFAYDTYGKLLTRTGTNKVIFGYNGRDGVVTDDNGLIYMRARYYSPNMKRFINADIIAGAISNAITLNRYAYANGNPVSFIDPFGLSAWSWLKDKYNKVKKKVVDTYNDVKDYVVDTYNDAKKAVSNAYRETKEWVTDTYQDVKERVVNTYNDVKENIIDPVSSFVEEKIVEPVVEKVEAIADQLNINDSSDVLRTVTDIGVTGIALTSGVINGHKEYMRKGGLLRPVSAFASAIVKGVATFGAVNNFANGLYYNLTPDDVKSDITSSSYSNNGTKYINRWDRLDYTKQQTQQSNYNFNAWMYYSEYNFHMHVWNGLNLLGLEDSPTFSGFAGSASDANVQPNDPFFDFNNTDGAKKWLRMISYFGVGSLGI